LAKKALGLVNFIVVLNDPFKNLYAACFPGLTGQQGARGTRRIPELFGNDIWVRGFGFAAAHDYNDEIYFFGNYNGKGT